MDHALSAIVEVDSSKTTPSQQQTVYNISAEIPTTPQKAKARTYHSVPHSRAASPDIELESMQWNYSIPQTPTGYQTPAGIQTPASEKSPFFQDVEMKRIPSLIRELSADNGNVEALQSFSNPPMNRYHMLCICLFTLGQGLSESAPGALLPYIEKDFEIGYAVVSLIFISNAIGFVAAASMTLSAPLPPSPPTSLRAKNLKPRTIFH